MAQGSRVQSLPFISPSSLPSQNDSSIHLSAHPWLQFHHKSAEQTDEEEKRRGAQGGDKGLGILCRKLAEGSAIVLQTKEQWWKAVETLGQRKNGNGCRDYGCMCMCACAHSRSLRFVSKTWDFPWWKNVIAYVLREGVHGLMSLLSKGMQKKTLTQIRDASKNMQAVRGCDW